LNVDPQPIDGDEQDVTPVRMLAVIDENNCIGCTKCIQACPVDAIVGATRAMHTVMSDLCTGCNLCVDPCPTQCIELRPVAETTRQLEMGFKHHSCAHHSRGTTCLSYSLHSEK
jgi:electron transport complex protein RnfB